MKISKQTKVRILTSMIAATSFALCACSSHEDDLIDAESRLIINTKPLIETGETPWATKPTEKLAYQIIDALKADSPDLAKQIKICAANDNPASSQCDDGEAIDERCLIRKGLWKGFLSPHLRTASTDLNGDGIPDYVLRISGCGIYYAYTWDVYVLLSQQGQQHYLALETNTNRFDVMPIEKFGGKIIVEGISSYNGESARIYVLRDGRYAADACFYRAQSEKVMRKTACKPAPTQNTSNR